MTEEKQLDPGDDEPLELDLPPAVEPGRTSGPGVKPPAREAEAMAPAAAPALRHSNPSLQPARRPTPTQASTPPQAPAPLASRPPGHVSNPGMAAAPAPTSAARPPGHVSNPGMPAAPAPASAARTSSPGGPPVSNPGMAAAPRPPGQRRPFEGWGAAIGRGFAAAAGVVIRVSSLGVSKARVHGGKAIHDFNQRPEHTRWRAYAFASYSVVCVMTLAFQLWEPNSLKAYVKVQHITLPESTVIFVRNDSRNTWRNVKMVLNGVYAYERNDMQPGQHVQLPSDRFALTEPSGKMTFAPKNIALQTLTIDCDRGHLDQELDK